MNIHEIYQTKGTFNAGVLEKCEKNEIRTGDFILILDRKRNYCKFLVLTGKSIGKIGWENEHFFKENLSYFKKIETI